MTPWTMFALGLAIGLVVGILAALQILGQLMEKIAPGFIQMVERKLDAELAEAKKDDAAWRAELSRKIAALGGGR